MNEYQKYLSIIESEEKNAIETLLQWSNTNSGSYHTEGVQAFSKQIELFIISSFNHLTLDIQHIELEPFQEIDRAGNAYNINVANGLQISKVNDNASYHILLAGHLDTVFAKDNTFQHAIFCDTPEHDISHYKSISERPLPNIEKINNVINGPGVADLKGGLMVMVQALKALESSPFADKIQWTIALNPDEEIGSKASNEWLSNIAPNYDIGLVFEPALPNGDFAGARKGSGNFTAVFHGVNAHAGRDFFSGKNAIVAQSQFITQIATLTGQKEGLTVNPAYIHGGGALNAVPDFSLVKYNIRFDNIDDQDWINQRIEAIINDIQDNTGCKIQLHGFFTRLPKKLDARHLALYEAIVDSAQTLGMSPTWHDTGGCCDGNNLSAAGLVNIDTLGVVGGNLHRDDEFMFTQSLIDRAKLTALFLMRLANDDLGQ